MGSFENARAIELPGWLADPTGEAYQRVLGRAQDVELRRLKDAVLAAFPATAPEDAAQLIGRDQDLEQAPGETAQEFLARCGRALDIWYWGGTKRGIREVFEPLNVPDGDVVVLDDHETSFSDDGSGWWSRVYILVNTTFGPWDEDLSWDDPGTWDDGGTWDSTILVAEVEYIRRRVRKVKSPGAYPVVLFLVMSSSDGGDGAWDDVSALWDEDIGEVWDGASISPVVPIILGHVWGEEETFYGTPPGNWDDPGDVWDDFA